MVYCRGMNLPPVMVEASLNDREAIQRTGKIASRIATRSAGPQLALWVAVVVATAQPSDPGAAAPKPLMKMNAMTATQRKIRIEIADPMPRFSAVKRLS